MTVDYDDPAALTEAADQLEAQARDTREQSAQQIADLERQLAETRAEVERLDRAARNAQGANYSVEAEAKRLEYCANAYRGAVRLREQAAALDQTAEALTAEAEQLREQDAGYGERLEQVNKQREQAQAALEAAREAADVASIASATATISACEQAAQSLTEQRRPGLDRLAAIGDQDGPGELREALRTAAGNRRNAEDWLDQADPQRPSAIRARQVAQLERERALTLAALESVAAEATKKRGNRTVQIGPDGRAASVIARRG